MCKKQTKWELIKLTLMKEENCIFYKSSINLNKLKKISWNNRFAKESVNSKWFMNLNKEKKCYCKNWVPLSVLEWSVKLNTKTQERSTNHFTSCQEAWLVDIAAVSKAESAKTMKEKLTFLFLDWVRESAKNKNIILIIK